YFVGTGHVLARPEAQCSYRQMRVHMQAKYGFRNGILQYAGRDHETGAAGAFFFTRLKYKFDSTFKVIAEFLQYHSRTQQAGSMYIVPAGMHYAFMLRPVGH